MYRDMARRDLTNAEVEQMGRENPGSAAEYLRLRRQELAQEKKEAREREDEELWIEAFVANGGEREAARKAYRNGKNEAATIQAVLTGDASREMVRANIARSL
jgi:hypothetical protein